MQRLIDVDVLIKKCGEWYVEEGPEEGFIGTIKQLLESQPIVHVSDKDADMISRQAAIEDVGDGVYTGSKIRRWLKSLPSVQPNHNADPGKKVDAIPVEWIKAKMRNSVGPAGKYVIDWLLTAWREESKK